MRYSLYQEFYKLTHKKVTWFAPLIMILLMVALGMTYGSNGARWLIMTSCGVNEWIALVLVLVGSTLFSMEFQNNAILTLLYKSPTRLYIYFSKFIVIFVYNILLHLLALVFTLVLNMLLPNCQFALSSTYQYGQSLAMNMVLTAVLDLITTLFVISLIFLMSCLINENSVVVAINIGLVFMGQGISNQILNFYDHLLNIVKWNPFNMINLTLQYANYPVYRVLTKLSNLQLFSATMGYTLLFFSLGYLVFRKKHF